LKQRKREKRFLSSENQRNSAKQRKPMDGNRKPLNLYSLLLDIFAGYMMGSIDVVVYCIQGVGGPCEQILTPLPNQLCRIDQMRVVYSLPCVLL
jgi:hypothetical protein